MATKKSATRGGRPSAGATRAKPPAPGPGERALGDPRGERARDAGIDGVAARLEHLGAGAGAQRMARRDRASHVRLVAADTEAVGFGEGTANTRRIFTVSQLTRREDVESGELNATP